MYNSLMHVVRSYQNFLNFLVADRPHLARSIQNHTLTVITTGLLMWAYAALALKSIDSPWPGIVGLVASAVHLVSPLLYRVSANVLLNASIMLLAGIIHQATFAYFTGGFQSHLLIWFGVLPFLGALIAGKAGAILWCAITLVTASCFLALHLSGYPFPNLITEAGHLTAQLFLVFGWIGLTSILSFFYLHQEAKQRETQLEQKNHIENLFRVLCHDLGNPLALLQIAMDQAQTHSDPTKRARSLEISQRAIANMVDITSNVRRMYSVQEGQAELQCVPMALNTALEQIQFLFQTSFAKKNITLHYDVDRHHATVVLVDPVSFVHQVLGNIFSNAVKFSPLGGHIFVEAAPLEDGLISLRLRDEGIGMPAKMCQHLFDVNAKNSRPGTQGEQGTGFGMHLMKTFVEKYGGGVRVESVENHGTSFILTLKGHVS